jgi:hypothetical protein
VYHLAIQGLQVIDKRRETIFRRKVFGDSRLLFKCPQPITRRRALLAAEWGRGSREGAAKGSRPTLRHHMSRCALHLSCDAELIHGKAQLSPANTGGQFIRRPIGEGLFANAWEGRHPRAEQLPRG